MHLSVTRSDSCYCPVGSAGVSGKKIGDGTKVPQVNDSKKSISRELKVDLLRGLALLTIFIDHVEEAIGVVIISAFTIKATGYSDAANVFVFLSGYVAQISIGRRLESRGFIATQLHAAQRVAQIYGAHVGILLLLSAVGRLQFFQFIWSSAPLCYIWAPSERPIVINSLLLIRQPYAFQILPLYIPFVAAAPTVSFMATRRPMALFACSLALYLASQAYQGIAFAGIGYNSGWFFNPMSWQIMFVLGILVKSRTSLSMLRKPRGRVLFVVILGIVVIAMGINERSVLMHRIEVIWNAHWGTFYHFDRLLNKSTNGPLRILHSMSILGVVGVTLPRSHRLWERNAILRGIILLGQNSLLVYTASIALTYAAAAWCVVFGSSAIPVVVCEVNGALLLYLCAFLGQSVTQQWMHVRSR